VTVSTAAPVERGSRATGQPSPPAAANASLDELTTCIAAGTRESWLNSQGGTAIGHAVVEVSVL